jgi:hypothetical protein
MKNKHTIVVDISYSPNKYSLAYQNSINMNFKMQDSKPIIHPHYNRWVGDLLAQVRLEMGKL